MLDVNPEDDPRKRAQESIRKIVDQIVQLSKAELSVETFYFKFLLRVVRALRAVDGIVWRPNLPQGAEILARLNLGMTSLSPIEGHPFAHRLLLHDISLGGDSARLPPVPPKSTKPSANPTPFLLLICPVRYDDTTFQIVEILQRPVSCTRTQRGYMRFLEQMSSVAADFMQRQGK